MFDPTSLGGGALPESDSLDAAPNGRRRFLQGVGAGVGVGLATGLTTLGLDAGAAHALPAGASQFVALPEVKRVLDTRKPTEYEYTAFGNNYVRVPIADRYGVPADAVAIVATVTTVNLVGGNWLTVQPAGADIQALLAQNKLVSALNMSYPGEAVANLSQVKLSAGGVDLFSLGPCEMILDLIGYYRQVPTAVREGRFIGLDKARRALDTRDTFGLVGSRQTLEVDLTDFVPIDASAAVINLTAVNCQGPGYFTVFPSTSSEPPFASSLNVNRAGDIRAAAVIAPTPTVNGLRTIKIFVLEAASVIVDVTGYFTSTTSALSQVGLFVPVDPVRILDTRDPGQIGRLWPNWIVEGTIPSPGATEGAAAVVNLTGVDSRGEGFLTIWAARTPWPGTSNLNFTGAWQVIPNHAISAVTATHGFQVRSITGSHVIVDYLGYYTGSPGIPSIAAPNNQPPPPIGPEWILRVPRIGLTSRVRSGDPTRVTDAGHSWHWTGTGYMGQEAHAAAFAHRTEHGGPYRYLHLLEGGDTFTLTTGDGREYTYVVVRRDLTDAQTENILAATRIEPGTTFSLIACTRPDYTPTSLSYRIVVTGVLVGWREI